MIEGLIFLTELVMMFLLLVGVVRTTRTGQPRDLGLFAPRQDEPPNTSETVKQRKGPHA